MTGIVEYDFAFPLERGLHARPAAALRGFAQAFSPVCLFRNERNGRSADLQDLLSLIATDTGPGDPCRLTIQGPDASMALRAFETYLSTDFLDTDEEPEVLQNGSVGTVLRRLLDDGGVHWHTGVGLSGGVGQGPAWVLGGFDLAKEPLVIGDQDPDSEQRTVSEGLRKVEADLAASATHADHGTTRSILEAHRAILQDRAWRASIFAGIHEQRLTARSAVVAAGRKWVEALAAADQPLLKDRVADIKDLTGRLLRALDGSREDGPALPSGIQSVLVARDLTLSQFLALPFHQVAGLVVAECGPTSHLAILARTFGVPFVGGLSQGSMGLKEGTVLLVDGRRGLVVLDPPVSVSRYTAIEREARESLVRRMCSDSSRKARTKDGQSLTILANISLAEEVSGALALGAEGVGLFRTETLCVEAGAIPEEARQAAAYRSALLAAEGLPVTLRLFDAGGDKPIPGLAMPRESNPFLGLRAVRWYPARAEVVRTQLRAALLAAPAGSLNLLVPMVATRAELAWVRALLMEVASGMGLPVPPLGIMVEVPALALHLAAVADLADFFCVGTNDLVQYLFATDRGNPAVARPEFDWHPATLRLLDLVVREAARLGRPLSLCGEMAADPDLLPLLAGLGFRTLSMAPSAIPQVKYAAKSLDMARASGLARAALDAPDAMTVRALLRSFRSDGSSLPLVEPDLVVLDAACASREEALKLLVERLHGAGRTDHPDEVEEAIWARERVVATGVGHGYAVPHCQASALIRPSLAILRLGEPIRWGCTDEELVHTVILLALPGEEAQEDHLRVFAHLARRLMRESFRSTLEGIREAADMAAFLARETEGLL